MSGMLASQVWKYKLDKTSLVVLMALCDIADDDGTSCYPRPRYVAWKTGSSVATCYRMIEKFSERGVLEQVGWRGETPEYNVHLEKLELKPDYERPRKGRPRKKSSHHEKTFSPRENNLTMRKDSHSEKSLLTVRKVFSPRERFSHGENEEHRLQVSQNEAGSGVVSKHDAPESLLLNHSYDPILEIHGASQKNDDEKTPETAEQSAEPEPSTPLPPASLPADLVWIQAQSILRQSISAAQYSTYMTGVKLYTAPDNTCRFTLVTPTAYTAEQIRGRYRTHIMDALRAVARGPVAGLEVIHQEARVTA